jgi:hypothetical protein
MVKLSEQASQEQPGTPQPPDDQHTLVRYIEAMILNAATGLAAICVVVSAACLSGLTQASCYAMIATYTIAVDSFGLSASIFLIVVIVSYILKMKITEFGEAKARSSVSLKLLQFFNALASMAAVT